MKRIMLVMLVLAAAVTATAGDFNLPPGKWWENERVAQRIRLTDQQQRAINDLVYRHAHRMIDLNAAVKRAELELAELVGRAELDAEAVRAAFAGFQSARQALETERFEMLLAVRETLSDEQWRELLEMRRQLERLREGRPANERLMRPRSPRPGGVGEPPGGGR